MSNPPLSIDPEFFSELEAEHRACRIPCQLRAEAETLIRDILATAFPHFAVRPPTRLHIASRFQDIHERLAATLKSLCEAGLPLPLPPGEVATRFLAKLPEVRRRLRADAEAIDNHDPAAESVDEVILAYPGFLAIAVYRFAHELLALQVPLLPRVLTEWAHRETGIDIHPGAQIGSPFVIDHGTGIVIGQTTRIGDRVKIYQGVTLGALSVTKDLASTRRHPTIEDDVVIYAGATILGGNTTVGRGTVIGGNVWLTSSVPPGSVVTHQSQVRVRPAPETLESLSKGQSPDALDFLGEGI
ncbi:MAG: serine O-acetyltransferase EpsC [Fimbriimonadaceae bacterium]